MSKELDQVLAERGSNYGDFSLQAKLSQDIKQVCFAHLNSHNEPGLKAFTPVMAESLELIIHKIARIINGNPEHVDSWRDISGYAQLVADRLEKAQGSQSDGVLLASGGVPAMDAPGSLDEAYERPGKPA